VVDVAATRERVLADLKVAGLISDHRLVAEHSVVMDPAYVHITKRSLAEHARLAGELRLQGVYPVGRYGGWTYCSIEDNIVEARALAIPELFLYTPGQEHFYAALGWQFVGTSSYRAEPVTIMSRSLG